MAIPPAPSAPPTSVSVPDLTSSSITVQWGPVDCIHRNGDITGYTVRVRASGEAERTVSVDESVRETTMSGLTPFTEYTVSVAAENNVDIGVYSGRIIIRTEGKLSTHNKSTIPSACVHPYVHSPSCHKTIT